MKRRLWITLSLMVAATLLVTHGAAAQGGKGSGDELASANPYTVYLPVALRNYRGCTAVPTLISPANGSTLTTIAPLFVWDLGNDPATTSFVVEVATDTTFADGLRTIAGSGHGQYQVRFSANSDPSTTYYWRARLVCGNMQAPYTEVWSFTTGSGGTLLPGPTLLAPGNGASVRSTMVTLRWSPVPGAVQYMVMWRRLPPGGYTYNFMPDTQTTQLFSANTSYEWWVNVLSDYGIGPDSEHWQFTTPAGSPP